MELNAFWGSLLRRWYLVAAAAVIAIVAVVVVLGRSAPTYKAEGTVLVFPPTQVTIVNGERQTPGNPFLELGGLTPIRDLLIRTMTATEYRMEMAKDHPDASFEVASDYTTSGPLLVIDVSAPSNDAAISALNAIIKSVPETVAALQRGPDFPKRAPRVTAIELTKDPVAALDRKGQIRSAIVVGAGLLTVELLAIGLVDGLLRRRRGPGDEVTENGDGDYDPEYDTDDDAGRGRVAPDQVAYAPEVASRHAAPAPGQPWPAQWDDQAPGQRHHEQPWDQRRGGARGEGPRADGARPRRLRDA